MATDLEDCEPITPTRLRRDAATWGIDAFTDAQVDYIMEYVVTTHDDCVPQQDYDDRDAEANQSERDATSAVRIAESAVDRLEVARGLEPDEDYSPADILAAVQAVLDVVIAELEEIG